MSVLILSSRRHGFLYSRGTSRRIINLNAVPKHSRLRFFFALLVQPKCLRNTLETQEVVSFATPPSLRKHAQTQLHSSIMSLSEGQNASKDDAVDSVPSAAAAEREKTSKASIELPVPYRESRESVGRTRDRRSCEF